MVARRAVSQMVPQSTSLAPQFGDALVRARVGDSGFESAVPADHIVIGTLEQEKNPTLRDVIR
jgi:hypothetical protein